MPTKCGTQRGIVETRKEPMKKTQNKASHPTPTGLQFNSERVHGADGQLACREFSGIESQSFQQS